MSEYWRQLWQRVRGSRNGSSSEGVVEGFIGADLAGLQRTDDFFRFFHFESIGVEKAYPDGDEVIAFKPSGPAFRGLVTLHSWVSHGIIRTVRLSVKRSFIDDPATCVYAADLYNSFLRRVGDVSPGDAIDAFANEITARSMARSSRPVLTAQPPPQASGEPSPACRAYIGQAEAENLDYRSGRLRLVARNDDGEFEILVWPEPR
ncbi:MAG: hypothetical protein WDO13_14600 [Verrucomicrobiota bacterium]